MTMVYSWAFYCCCLPAMAARPLSRQFLKQVPPVRTNRQIMAVEVVFFAVNLIK